MLKGLCLVDTLVELFTNMKERIFPYTHIATLMAVQALIIWCDRVAEGTWTIIFQRTHGT